MKTTERKPKRTEVASRHYVNNKPKNPRSKSAQRAFDLMEIKIKRKIDERNAQLTALVVAHMKWEQVQQKFFELGELIQTNIDGLEEQLAQNFPKTIFQEVDQICAGFLAEHDINETMTVLDFDDCLSDILGDDTDPSDDEGMAICKAIRLVEPLLKTAGDAPLSTDY